MSNDGKTRTLGKINVKLNRSEKCKNWRKSNDFFGGIWRHKQEEEYLAFWFRPGFGYGRNSKFNFGIVTASRNSDIELGKHGIILQPFPNAVSACPYAKLASSGSGVA